MTVLAKAARWRLVLRSVREAAILALVIALSLQTRAQAGTTEDFIVKAENMSPRLEINQRVEFDLAAYATQPPEVGDIVLIRPPRGALLERCGSPRHAAPDKLCVRPFGRPDTTVKFVMRVVASAGDRVTFRRGLVVRNGQREHRRTTVSRCSGDACTFRGTITVPAGHVYVAGDNRGSSDDSRYWGALPTAQVLGRYVRTAGTCGC